MATKAYTATLDDKPVYLARIDRALTVMDMSDGSTTELEPEMLDFCGDVREVPPAEAPAIVARMRGCHDHHKVCMGS